MDAKIFHLPMLAALDIARTFADKGLQEKMQRANLSHRPTAATKALERLGNSDLGTIMNGGAQGTRSPGKKSGSNTEEAFQKLVSIAQTSDSSVNRAIGESLKAAGLISDYKTEQDFGTGLSRCIDLYCSTPTGIIRMERMWRARTRRAEIANYTLRKLFNYGRAIGYLEK